MRGRRPKPSAIRLLDGNPGKRALNDAEPHYADTLGRHVPRELKDDKVATAEWRRLLRLMRGSRVMTDADRGSLIALCQQWSRYLEASEKAALTGLVVKTPSGYPLTNPYLSIANKSLAHCVKLWAELGLTPSSRSRVKQLGGDDDPFAEFDEPQPSAPTSTSTTH